MRLLLALAVAAALLLPVSARADKVYKLYWVTYYAGGAGGVTISLVDPKHPGYPTFDACQAAEASWSSPGGIRSWSNAGYYMCM